MSGLQLAHVEDLLTALRGLEAVEAADLDPGKVNRLPGVWVRIDRIERERLDADDTIGVELHLAVGDKDPGRAWAALQTLYNAVTDLVTPTGPTRAATLNMPDRAALPALVVPFDLVP